MNTGQIIKSKSAGNYTVIPNEILRSTNLSWQAKGLMCYLLSLPDDWVLYKEELHSHSSDGRHCTRSSFKELENNGFILSVEVRNELGQFKGYNYIVYEIPTNKSEPISENPISDTTISVNLKSENETLLNTNNTNTNNTNTKDISQFKDFIAVFNKITKRSFSGDSQTKRQFNARSKEGKTLEDFERAIKIANNDSFLVEGGWLTPEYITRASKLEYWLNKLPQQAKQILPSTPEEAWKLKQELKANEEKVSKDRMRI